MLLYRMELYKMFCRRIVWISGIVMVLLLGFYFLALMDEERSTVEGVTRFGYAAIQEDRRITKEFEGILTDEKLQQIAEKYGFVSQVKNDYGGWWDKNYLTEFVADYFSDGYMIGWDVGEYQIPKQLMSIKESKIREDMRGEDIYFGYSRGWTKYVKFMQFAGYILIVWLVIVLSPLFAQEHDTNMHALLFTTENGSTKDISARILAAFSMTLMSFLAVALISFLGIWIVYGLDGAQELWEFGSYHWTWSAQFTKAQYCFWYLLRCGMGILMTCSFCMIASAESKSNFESLLIVGGMLFVPFVLFILGMVFEVLYVICISQPVYLISASFWEDVRLPCDIFLYISTFFIIACTLAGKEKWIKSELRDY